jgi:prolyl oligopeptidase PreP (S9A serine peptidase family)
MIYIFLIIFVAIQCRTVTYNIKEYDTLGYVAYSINNGEKKQIESFYEYLYLKKEELDVSKNYDIKLYTYQDSRHYNIIYSYWTIKSQELMRLKEYYNVKKNNSDFNIMFSPIGLKKDENENLFFEFLKNNSFPRIFIILRHRGDKFYLSEMDIYSNFYNTYYLENEFIFISLNEFSFYNNKDNDILTCVQLFSIEKNMMFYIYNINSFTGKINIDSAEYAKFIIEKVNKTEDNREQFKTIPKVFIIVGEYKLNSISKEIFIKAGFSYTSLDSEDYYLIFFKTNMNFQPIKNEVKEYNSRNFSITTFGKNNSYIFK